MAQREECYTTGNMAEIRNKRLRSMSDISPVRQLIYEKQVIPALNCVCFFGSKISGFRWAAVSNFDYPSSPVISLKNKNKKGSRP